MKKTIKNAIYEEIQNDVLQKINNKKIELNKSTIERILLMQKESNSKEKFLKNVNGIKDNKKLNKVLQIVNNDSNLYELQAYKDYLEISNNNISQSEKDTFLLEYIKQFFIILKIKGGENNDN